MTRRKARAASRSFGQFPRWGARRDCQMGSGGGGRLESRDPCQGLWGLRGRGRPCK